jgi:cytidylate kinase
MSQRLTIAIDGPAGAGKSTTARKVAEHLGYVYIDTGAMYRAVTFAALREHVPMDDAALGALAERLDIRLEPTTDGQRVVLNGEDVTRSIREAEVTSNVSQVSVFPSVRRALVQRQRMLGLNGGVVMDGRDIGSVVFPHAEIKVFLVADVDERVRRRVLEAEQRGERLDIETVRTHIIERDKLDSEREVSPLIKPEGATEIDTTHCTIADQVQRILELVDAYHKTYSLVSAFTNI